MATRAPAAAATDDRPSMPRLMLAAFDAGTAAAADPTRTRASNPHQGDEPGETALYQRWLDGFNTARGVPRR